MVENHSGSRLISQSMPAKVMLRAKSSMPGAESACARRVSFGSPVSSWRRESEKSWYEK
jgi:hypothetical protein